VYQPPPSSSYCIDAGAGLAMRRASPWGTAFRAAAGRAFMLACAAALAMPLDSQARDYVVGVIAGLSGAGKSYGAGIVQGAEMALREINAAGGVNGHKLVLKVHDDKSDPARSAIAMRRLLATAPDVIVGGWGSSQVLAHMDLVEQSAIPYLIVGATSPAILNPRNRWIFRVIPGDDVMADQLAQRALGAWGLKRIAVISDSNAYGVGSRDLFVTALRKRGAVPVTVQSYHFSATDFTPQLLRIRSTAPDALAIFATMPAAPAIMKQARALGIPVQFIGTGGLLNEAILGAAPAASQGTRIIAYFHQDIDAQTHAWTARYLETYQGRRVTNPAQAALAYLAVKQIAARCLGRVGSDRVEIRNCIAQWRGNPLGLGADAFFGAHGQLTLPTVTVEVRGNAFHLRTEQGPEGK